LRSNSAVASLSQVFFKVIDPASDLYHKLNSELVAFLAKYGKAPSTKVRINVSRGIRREFRSDEESGNGAYDTVVELMVEVARTLPAPQLKYLREQLEHVWV